MAKLVYPASLIVAFIEHNKSLHDFASPMLPRSPAFPKSLSSACPNRYSVILSALFELSSSHVQVGEYEATCRTPYILHGCRQPPELRVWLELS